MTTDLNALQAQIQAIKGNDQPEAKLTPQGLVASKTGVIKDESKNRKDGETKIDRRKFNRGHPQSGRKPAEATVIARSFKSWMLTHANEDVWVRVTEYDKHGIATGKIITIKRPRIANAMNKLYEMGIRNEGDAQAISMWLDRYLGKAAQPIRGEGEDDAPIQLGIHNLGELIHRVYGGK